MKTIYKNKLIRTGLFVIIIIQAGCTEDLLDQKPIGQLSEDTFWESSDDTFAALTGIYEASNIGDNSYSNLDLILSSSTDDSGYKNGDTGLVFSGYFNSSDDEVVPQVWEKAYEAIYRANYFLENIDKVSMDEGLKSEYIAEAKFIRAYEYFFMSVLYGGVPLIAKVLTIEEANNQSRNSLEEIQKFVIDECTEAAENLPFSRPDDDRGRILKGAAIGIKGRVLLIQKEWEDATIAFKSIIDSDSYNIEPDYESLFGERGRNSNEIILSTNTLSELYGNTHNQLNFHPDFYGGYQETNIYQNLVDSYQMIDGLSIEESPLYDPNDPFENRDPRLYATVFLPGYTIFREEEYPADPKALQISDLPGATGYGWKKFVTENYEGDKTSSGDNIILMRYAEILLGYLEAKVENNDEITQNLLDETINKVRGRESVDMPPITINDLDELKKAVRQERRVEFATERLIRYMDIRRWDIYYEVMNKEFYGLDMELVDTDSSVQDSRIEKSGPYKGHLKIIDKRGTIKEGSDLIPIPLSEIEINPNMDQNPGY